MSSLAPMSIENIVQKSIDYNDIKEFPEQKVRT
jgi:hypothetical protein